MTVRVTGRSVPYNCPRLKSRGERVRKWFIVSAVGRDRPGIVADLAQLVFDCEANLEDSRMTLLGNEFAAIMLCSGWGADLEQRLAKGVKRLEWENRLTVFVRPLEGEPRPAVPAPGTRLYAIETQGMDRAGIVAGICRTLADYHVNIADLHSSSLPSPSGAAVYRMKVLAEVPESLDPARLAKALEERGAQLGVDVSLAPA